MVSKPVTLCLGVRAQRDYMLASLLLLPWPARTVERCTPPTLESRLPLRQAQAIRPRSSWVTPASTSALLGYSSDLSERNGVMSGSSHSSASVSKASKQHDVQGCSWSSRKASTMHASHSVAMARQLKVYPQLCAMLSNRMLLSCCAADFEAIVTAAVLMRQSHTMHHEESAPQQGHLASMRDL